MPNLFSNTLIKYTQMLKELLLIIEYSDEEADDYASKFLILIESKVLSKVHNRLDKKSQKELDNLLITLSENKDNKDRFTEIYKQTQDLIFNKLNKKEIQLLYKEQFIDIFEDWFKQVLPTSNDSQKKEIRRILDKYAFGLGI